MGLGMLINDQNCILLVVVLGRDRNIIFLHSPPILASALYFTLGMSRGAGVNGG